MLLSAQEDSEVLCIRQRRPLAEILLLRQPYWHSVATPPLKQMLARLAIPAALRPATARPAGQVVPVATPGREEMAEQPTQPPLGPLALVVPVVAAVVQAKRQP
jgi:hypothetical protein